MRIRKSTEEDSQILAGLFSILYRATLKWSENEIRDNIIFNKKEYYLDSNQLGALALKFNNENCELEAIVVKNKWNGLGPKLLKFAEKLAERRECKKIWCYNLELYGAGDFYRKHGWAKKEFIRNFFDGQDCFIYEKQLFN